MTPKEKDERLLYLLNLHFTPYEYSADDLRVAADKLADEIDRDIINHVVEAAKLNGDTKNLEK